MHKDFLGYELAIGDEVVYMTIGYRDLVRGNIVSLGLRKATICRNIKGKDVKNI